MKFSTCTVAALFVAPVVGFTVTMSSVAYLDRISTGGGLTSFAPSTPANYSPASYNAPAPAPYKSPFADLPPSNDVNYMQNLAGGNAMKSGKNYSGVSRKFSASSSLPYAPAAPSTQQVAAAPAPAPAPYASSFAAAPATDSLNYMGSLGGGNQMKSGKNYSGVSGSKWGPVKSTGFVPSAPAPAPYAAASEPSGASNPLNYMGSLGGGSAMKSGKNYSGVSNKFGPTKSSSYLDAVTAAAPATTYSSGSASVPVASGTSYLGALGGGSAMKSGKNYLGMSSKFGPTQSNSYLDAVSGASPVVSSSSAGPANYMTSLGGGSAMKSGKNYSGVSNKFAPTKSSSYIDQVTSAASFSSSPSTQAAGVVSGPLNYMGSLGGGGAMKSGKNYSGVSRTFGATKSNSYLDQVTQAAPVTSSSPAAPVANSLNYMGSLGGGSAMKSGKNFAGVSNKFGPVRSSNSYLDQVKNNVMPSSSYAPAAPAAAATSYTYSPPTPAPAVAAVPALNYMSSLGGNTNVATTVKKNYSGFGSTFASAKSGNSYLESVKNGAVQMAPPSYSTYNPMQAQAAAVSSSYNSMQNSFAAATGQASYQQQQPAQPAPASTSSYLSSL